MRKTTPTPLSRARAILARLCHYRHRSAPSKPDRPDVTQPHGQKLGHERPNGAGKPTVLRASLRKLPRSRASRARSDMHVDNQAMQKRLAELETIEMENSSLKVQIDDLQRALDGMTEQSAVGELHMADIENSSLRLQVECLRSELRRPFYGAVDVVDRRLAWLNVDPL